jgi:hypothetical protein
VTTVSQLWVLGMHPRPAGATRRCPVQPSTPLGPDQVNVLLSFFVKKRYTFLLIVEFTLFVPLRCSNRCGIPRVVALFLRRSNICPEQPFVQRACTFSASSRAFSSSTYFQIPFLLLLLLERLQNQRGHQTHQPTQELLLLSPPRATGVARNAELSMKVTLP